MAVNRVAWVGNVNGASEPLILKGLFDAGATTAIKSGEILEKTGTGNTVWVPLDADYDMTGASDAVAVAGCEIKSGDRAGYYPVIVPRPGDIFEFELATAAAVALGAALYYSTSQKLTTSGSNIIGYACGDEHYPPFQGHLADDGSPDMGVTVKSTSYVRMSFKQAASWFSGIFI